MSHENRLRQSCSPASTAMTGRNASAHGPMPAGRNAVATAHAATTHVPVCGCVAHSHIAVAHTAVNPETSETMNIPSAGDAMSHAPIAQHSRTAAFARTRRKSDREKNGREPVMAPRHTMLGRLIRRPFSFWDGCGNGKGIRYVCGNAYRVAMPSYFRTKGG